MSVPVHELPRDPTIITADRATPVAGAAPPTMAEAGAQRRSSERRAMRSMARMSPFAGALSIFPAYLFSLVHNRHTCVTIPGGCCMDVREAVESRFSCRAFRPDPVPEHVVREI